MLAIAFKGMLSWCKGKLSWTFNPLISVVVDAGRPYGSKPAATATHDDGAHSFPIHLHLQCSNTVS